MITGLLALIWWWVAASLLGLAAWPLVHRACGAVTTTAWARIAGVLGAGYLTWLAASLHGMPFSMCSCWFGVLLVALAGWLPPLLNSRLPAMPWRASGFRQQELVFAGCLLFFGILRMLAPDIYGTEKYADMSFLSSILRTDWFPPEDAWFAGEHINYFYFGHYLVGFLARLTGMPAAWGFNLGLVIVYALAASASFGLLQAMTGQVSAGYTGMVTVMFMGNLDPLRQLLRALSTGAQLWPPQWFNWWNSSRVLVRDGLDVTINEFPIWSFVLGDLHAHVLVLPITLLAAALAWRLTDPAIDRRARRVLLGLAVLTGAAVPAMNTWDTPVTWTLLLAGLAIGTVKQRGITRRSVAGFVLCAIGMVTGAFLLFLPFHRSFIPAGAGGIGVVPAALRSPPGLFLLIHGIFLLILTLYLVQGASMTWRDLSRHRRYWAAAGAGALLSGLFLSPVIALLLGLLGGVVMVFWRRRDHGEDTFALVLAGLALVLLLGVEFLYVKDAYGLALRRQNTVFKVYYQVWILLGLAAAYMIHRLEEHWGAAGRTARRTWRLGHDAVMAAGLLFALLGISIRYGNLNTLINPTTREFVTMDGARFLKRHAAGDYAVIEWLNEHVDGRSVVLEATGEAFSDYGRISAFTGLPTLLGWANHQSIWRDPTWNTCMTRTSDIETMYHSDDKAEAAALLAEYQVRYIVFGKLERSRYQKSGSERFGAMGDLVLDASTTELFRLRQRRSQ
ncbi:hypothetical protein JW905_16430 [bacterium]|nr:hypothetical protein [candidate division CSSED10-310 bacterium]